MKPFDPKLTARPATDTDAIISVAGLNKIYASGFQALRNVDLEVNSGERLGILGRNGAGKSTMIRLISGAERPTRGLVERDRRGREVFYALADGVPDLLDEIDALLGRVGDRVAGCPWSTASLTESGR